MLLNVNLYGCQFYANCIATKFMFFASNLLEEWIGNKTVELCYCLLMAAIVYHCIHKIMYKRSATMSGVFHQLFLQVVWMGMFRSCILILPLIHQKAQKISYINYVGIDCVSQNVIFLFLIYFRALAYPTKKINILYLLLLNGTYSFYLYWTKLCMVFLPPQTCKILLSHLMSLFHMSWYLLLFLLRYKMLKS